MARTPLTLLHTCATVRNSPFCLFIPGILINSLIKLKCFSHTYAPLLYVICHRSLICKCSMRSQFARRTDVHVCVVTVHFIFLSVASFRVLWITYLLLLCMSCASSALHTAFDSGQQPSISRPSAGLKRVVNSFVLLSWPPIEWTTAIQSNHMLAYRSRAFFHFCFLPQTMECGSISNTPHIIRDLSIGMWCASVVHECIEWYTKNV